MSDDENSPMTESSSIQTRQQASNFKENRENLQENKNLNNLENESSKSFESKTKLKVNIKGMEFYFLSIFNVEILFSILSFKISRNFLI